MATCLCERAVPLLKGTYTDAVGRELFSATAQLGRLADDSAWDVGDQARAQRHYIQALRLARAAGDVPLGGYVLASMSLQVLAQSETLLGQAHPDDGDPTWIDFFTHARLAADATEIHRNCRCRTW